MPEPTAAMVETIGEFIDGLKYPSFAWRHLLSAHNTAWPGGRSVNSSIEDTHVPRGVPVVFQATTVRPEVHYPWAHAMCALSFPTNFHAASVMPFAQGFVHGQLLA